MSGRKRELLRHMKIVYMSEGLDTIADLPNTSKRARLSLSSSSGSSSPVSSRSRSRQSSESASAKSSKISTPVKNKRKSVRTSPSSSEVDTVDASTKCEVTNSSKSGRKGSRKPVRSPSSKSVSSSSDIPEESSSSIKSSDSDLKCTSKRKYKTKKQEPKPKFEALIRNLPLSERRLMHARNGVPFSIADNSEDLPVDYSSTERYCAEKLDEFSDVNLGERKIMNMWNGYIIGIMGRGFVHLAKLIELFIRDKGREIVENHLFRNAMVMIDSFHESGILDSVDCFTAKSQLQVEVAEYMKTRNLVVCKQSARQGVGISTFYGTVNGVTTPNSSHRRSLDDHLPCRRDLSPDLINNTHCLSTDSISRTLSLDTRLDEDRNRISRKGRPRLNSKGGGGSPGRGSPVRGGATSSAGSSFAPVAEAQVGDCAKYRRTGGKKGSSVKKELWQTDASKSRTEESPLDFLKMFESPMFYRNASSGISAKNNFELSLSGSDRSQGSPEAIQNFLQAFDHKSFEDLENDLPGFVVEPKRVQPPPIDQDPGDVTADTGFLVLSDLNPEETTVPNEVTLKKRCSRSKTN